jgi:hypothetical protein
MKRSADQASLPSAPAAGGSQKKRLPEISTLASPSSDITETEPIDPDDIDLLFSDSADGDHADASTTDEVDTSRAFERQLACLKEYINVYGTTSVVAAVERFMSLNRFMAEWLLKTSNIAEGQTKQTSASFAKIQQLIDLGVDLGLDPEPIMAPRQQAKQHCYRRTQHSSATTKSRICFKYSDRHRQTYVMQKKPRRL